MLVFPMLLPLLCCQCLCWLLCWSVPNATYVIIAIAIIASRLLLCKDICCCNQSTLANTAATAFAMGIAAFASCCAAVLPTPLQLHVAVVVAITIGTSWLLIHFSVFCCSKTVLLMLLPLLLMLPPCFTVVWPMPLQLPLDVVIAISFAAGWWLIHFSLCCSCLLSFLSCCLCFAVSIFADHCAAVLLTPLLLSLPLQLLPVNCCLEKIFCHCGQSALASAVYQLAVTINWLCNAQKDVLVCCVNCCLQSLYTCCHCWHCSCCWHFIGFLLLPVSTTVNVPLESWWKLLPTMLPLHHNEVVATFTVHCMMYGLVATSRNRGSMRDEQKSINSCKKTYVHSQL